MADVLAHIMWHTIRVVWNMKWIWDFSSRCTTPGYATLTKNFICSCHLGWHYFLSAVLTPSISFRFCWLFNQTMTTTQQCVCSFCISHYRSSAKYEIVTRDSWRCIWLKTSTSTWTSTSTNTSSSSRTTTSSTLYSGPSHAHIFIPCIGHVKTRWQTTTILRCL